MKRLEAGELQSDRVLWESQFSLGQREQNNSLMNLRSSLESNKASLSRGISNSTCTKISIKLLYHLG